MARLATLAAVVLLVGSACGGSGRGSGVVTAGGRIGSLRIDVSTVADIVAFAGKPDETAVRKLSIDGRGPKLRSLTYWWCRDVSPCQTTYYVNPQTHRLAALETDSPSFRTTTGIRVNMAQDEADSRAHQTPRGPFLLAPALVVYRAIVYRSDRASLILASTCHRLKAGRCPGHVWLLTLESRQHPIGLVVRSPT